MKNIYLLDEYVSSAKNGIGTYLGELLYCFKKMEAQVCLIAFNSDRKEFCIEDVAGIKTICFPKFPEGDYNRNSMIVNRFLRLHVPDSPDTVFCFNHSPCGKLMQSVKESHPMSKQIYIIHDFSWTGPLLGNTLEYSRIVNSTTDSSVAKNKFLLDIWQGEKAMQETADRVVCLSAGTLQLLIDVYGTDKRKIHLIPNGLRKRKVLDNEVKMLLKKERYINENEKVILFVGRLTEPKGIIALLRALRIVLKTCPDVKLVISGASYSHPFSDFSDIASRVIYTGHLGNLELEKWYCIADVGIIPSYTEQCSYVGIEMMMHGLPIVASDGFGVRDMFHKDVNAIVAPVGRLEHPEDFVQNISDAILRLFASEELARQIGENAQRVYASQYNIGRMKKGYKKLLNSFKL